MNDSKKDEAKPPLKSFDQQNVAEKEQGRERIVRKVNPNYKSANNYSSRDNRSNVGQNRPTSTTGSSLNQKPYRVNDTRDTRTGTSRPESNRDNNYRGKFVPRKDTPFGTKKFQTSNPKNAPRGKFAPKAKKEKIAIPFIPIVSELQLTDGKHRGKYVKNTLSPKVKMTNAKIREIMFRLISRRVRFGRILDLCAGAGTIGFEAISREALLVTFVEKSSKMCDFIKKNMESLKIKYGHVEINEIEVLPFLKRVKKNKRQWDVVYFGPEYSANYEEVIEVLTQGIAIRLRGCLVLEHHKSKEFPEEIGNLHRLRIVTEGETSLTFFERR
jgi:16S rRNA (guanine966-N2)-methyltransferase